MLRDVLIQQKRELERYLKEPYVPRDCSTKPVERLINVILGPRRAGKSFFAIHWLAQHKLSFGYINFDDERLLNITNYDELIAALNSFYNQPQWLLLDEVQNLKNWELFINRLQRQGYMLVVTGSNAHMLSSELATHLTGRYFSHVIFPFSFKEHLQTITSELAEPEIKEVFHRYLEHGGFPEPTLRALDLKSYLSTLFQAVIYKDIVKRHRIRSSQGLDDLAFYWLSNVTTEASLQKLTRMTKLKSVHTVEKYLHYLEEGFLFFPIRRFSYKVKEQISQQQKIYCIDNGLVAALGFLVSPHVGRLCENLVAIVLYKQMLEKGMEVFFWRDQAQDEVDFVVKVGRRVTALIQISSNITDEHTQKRELRALLKASQALNCDHLLLLNETLEGERKETWFGIKRHVSYRLLWKWLTEPELA